jgi:hypothetical protein
MFPKHLINTKSKWYTLAKMVPCSEYEELLRDLFMDSGRDAIPVRWIIGSLLI